MDDFERRLRRKLWRAQILGEWLPLMLAMLMILTCYVISYGWHVPSQGEVQASDAWLFWLFTGIFLGSSILFLLLDPFWGNEELDELREMTQQDPEAVDQVIQRDFMFGEALWDRGALPKECKFVPQR